LDGQAAAARRRTLAGHRQLRAGYSIAAGAWRALYAGHRHAGRGHRLRHRGVLRHPGGLCRRAGRYGDHAGGRCHAVLSGAGAGHRAGRRLRPQPGERHDRGRRHHGAAIRPGGTFAGAGGVLPALCRCLPCARPAAAAHPAALCAGQRHRAPAGAGLAGCRQRRPADRQPRLSRPRGAAADAGMGRRCLGQPGLCALQPLDDAGAGLCHPAGGAVLQPDRRRAGRLVQPQAPEPERMSLPPIPVIALERVDFLPASRVNADTSILTLKSLVFEPMLRWQDGAIRPGLFTGWAQEAGGRRWRLTLPPGKRFHDGSPVLAKHAADFIRHILESRDMFGMPWSYARYLEGARLAADRAVLTIDTPAPFPDLPEILSEFYLPRLDAEGRPVIGTGDWRVEEFTPGASVLLARADRRRLRLVAIPLAEDRLAALQSGAVPAATHLEPPVHPPRRAAGLVRPDAPRT